MKALNISLLSLCLRRSRRVSPCLIHALCICLSAVLSWDGSIVLVSASLLRAEVVAAAPCGYVVKPDGRGRRAWTGARPTFPPPPAGRHRCFGNPEAARRACAVQGRARRASGRPLPVDGGGGRPTNTGSPTTEVRYALFYFLHVVTHILDVRAELHTGTGHRAGSCHMGECRDAALSPR